MSIASDIARVQQKYPAAHLVIDDSPVFAKVGRFWVETGEDGITAPKNVGHGKTVGKAWENARKRIIRGLDVPASQM
jgi:hypothetical protein